MGQENRTGFILYQDVVLHTNALRTGSTAAHIPIRITANKYCAVYGGWSSLIWMAHSKPSPYAHLRRMYARRQEEQRVSLIFCLVRHLQISIMRWSISSIWLLTDDMT